jgi:hypothetical protein
MHNHSSIKKLPSTRTESQGINHIGAATELLYSRCPVGAPDSGSQEGGNLRLSTLLPVLTPAAGLSHPVVRFGPVAL